MCGRFYLDENKIDIEQSFDVDLNQLDFQSRYNIAPTQQLLTITQDQQGKQARRMRWGLIPSWSNGIDSRYNMINARAESIHVKPAYRRPFKRSRCLIPASGYYEWKMEKEGKQPYCITRKDNELIAFAGIWDTWESKSDKIQSCSIITTHANQSLEAIHVRMPVIISAERFDSWLDPTIENEEKLRGFLEPFQVPDLIFWPISKAVNSPKNDYPEIINKLS